MRQALVIVLAVALGAAVGAQSSRVYRTRLSPVPVPAYNPTIVGSGTVTATLTGARLVVSGTYQGLNTPATVARIHKSQRTGMRGDPILDLTVSGGTSGTIAGQFDLTPAQVQEIGQGRYYVQLHSEKAPDGNLWGFLLAQENRR